MNYFLKDANQLRASRFLSWRNLCLLVTIILWAYYLLSMYRGSENLGYVLVQYPGGNDGVTSSMEVYSVSPWGTKTAMQQDGKGVWRIGKREKRVTKEFLILNGAPSAVAPAMWRVSVASGNEPEWRTPLVDKTGTNSIRLKLSEGSVAWSLLPSKRNVLNWLGDWRFLSLSFVWAVYPVSLIFLLGYSLRNIWKEMVTTLREYWIKIRPSRAEVLIYLILMVVFYLLNSRNYNLPTVMYRQFDELSIIREMEHWTRSPVNGLSSLVYGASFNWFALPFVILGQMLNGFGGEIVAGRMVSAFWMVVCLHLLWSVARGRGDITSAITLSLLLISVPFFWIMGTVLHPDAMMTALVLGGFILLASDRCRLGSGFIFGCALLGGAVAVKAHALMFAPVPALLCLASLGNQPVRQIAREACKGVWAAFVMFLLMEPRLFSAGYLINLIKGFAFQMWTNRTGFSVEAAPVIVPLGQKLATITHLYSPALVLIALLILAVSGIFCGEKSSKWCKAALFAGWGVVVVYYGWFLNKDWAYYYMSVCFVLYFLAFDASAKWPNILRLPAAVVMLVIQLIGAWPGLVSAAHDHYMPSQSTIDSQRALDQKLRSLAGMIGLQDGVLLAYGLAFDYSSCGLKEHQVRYIVTDTLKEVEDGTFSLDAIPRLPVVAISNDIDELRSNQLQKMRNYLLDHGYHLEYENNVACILTMKPKD